MTFTRMQKCMIPWKSNRKFRYECHLQRNRSDRYVRAK